MRVHTCTHTHVHRHTACTKLAQDTHKLTHAHAHIYLLTNATYGGLRMACTHHRASEKEQDALHLVQLSAAALEHLRGGEGPQVSCNIVVC